MSRRPRLSTAKTPLPPRSPADAHEWLSFEDPDENRTWVFDITFLLSHWNCIYGCGCQGVLTGPAPELEHGCCSYGAHMSDSDDVRRVSAAAAKLRPDQWQYHRRAPNGAFRRTRSGETVTRIVDGACIFLNRPGFGRGAGCALHQAALEDRINPMELKPDVCWQLPLRREDEDGPDGHVTSTVREWGRSHWGPGGSEFHWWCTEQPEAFHGSQPIYRSMSKELVAMVGEKPYRMLVRYLDGRSVGSVALPHPAIRRRNR